MTEIYVNEEKITPMGLADVLDIVEEELGADIRQYIEGYLMDDDLQSDLSESDRLADQKEHYLDILDTIDRKMAAVERMISSGHVKRKALVENVSSTRQIIERETNH